MRRVLALALLAVLIGACSTFRGGTAQENAVQALVTTTRSAVLLMTAAGIAYDAGAFGEPGSDRAEDTWAKIAAESLRMNEALNAWTEAIKTNKDAGVYQSMVSQALAVIGALLPTKRTSQVLGIPLRGHEMGRITPHSDGQPFVVNDLTVAIATRALLSCPDAFRDRFAVVGGSR